MAIVVVLLIIAAALLLTLGAVFVGSLALGGVLLANKRARVLVPLFFLVIPATLLGSLAGGLAVGYYAVRANENLIFLGPVGGLIAGGIVGLMLGLGGASLWWLRISRTSRSSNT